MDDVFYRTVLLFGIIPVRDTVISTWVMMGFILGVVLVLRRHMPDALEMFIDFVSDTVSDLLGRPAEPFLPFLGAVMLFLLVANNLGLLPFLATPTKDINTTLALALVVFFAVHYFGIRERGLWGYFKSLATPFFMLPLEVIGQLSRTMSLTLRLFGNVLSSEFIVAVIFSLVQPIAPLPMMLLGTISGVLQAYIFLVLASSYIASALGDSKT
jgi:F-type H+-transporting ATPase subunit a